MQKQTYIEMKDKEDAIKYFRTVLTDAIKSYVGSKKNLAKYIHKKFH